jgi:hypothetical protein
VPTEFLPILKAKYAAKMFGEMSLQELNIATTKMIADIAVITGWNIPTGAATSALINHLGSTLVNDYSELNYEEIILAFKDHSSKIKDYAKNLNLGLFKQVLNLYYEERNLACIAESDIAIRDIEEQQLSEEKILNDSRSTIQECYNNFLKEKFNPSESLISHSLFDTLVKDNIADENIMSEYIYQGFDKYRKWLMNEKTILTSIEQERAKSYGNKDLKMVQINEITSQLHQLEQVLKKCKAFSLQYCFEVAKQKKLEHFYIKE